MNCINYILKATGLTQQALADYIGVRRQSLMDAACFRRTLSRERMGKLSRLNLCLATVENKSIPDVAPTYNSSRSRSKNDCFHEAVDRQQDCRNKAHFLTKKLDRMEIAKRQCIFLLTALEKFEPSDEMEEKWLLMIRTEAIQKLDKHDEAGCRLLRKRIYLLHAEAGYDEQTTDEMKQF